MSTAGVGPGLRGDDDGFIRADAGAQFFGQFQTRDDANNCQGTVRRPLCVIFLHTRIAPLSTRVQTLIF
jgi:hypothetical protein